MALLDDRDPVTEPLSLVHEVCDQDDRRPPFADGFDEFPGHPPGGGVESGRHLIEEDQPGPVHQR